MIRGYQSSRKVIIWLCSAVLSFPLLKVKRCLSIPTCFVPTAGRDAGFHTYLCSLRDILVWSIGTVLIAAF